MIAQGHRQIQVGCIRGHGVEGAGGRILSSMRRMVRIWVMFQMCRRRSIGGRVVKDAPLIATSTSNSTSVEPWSIVLSMLRVARLFYIRHIIQAPARFGQGRHRRMTIGLFIVDRGRSRLAIDSRVDTGRETSRQWEGCRDTVRCSVTVHGIIHDAVRGRSTHDYVSRVVVASSGMGCAKRLARAFERGTCW